MTDWRSFLSIAGQHLRESNHWIVPEWAANGGNPRRKTWCSWTTFDRLEQDAGYWTAELPLETELGEHWTTDGGTWGEPFDYASLAHLLIPRRFREELASKSGQFFQWEHFQDIRGVSLKLSVAGIAHSLSGPVLEIKRF